MNNAIDIPDKPPPPPASVPVTEDAQFTATADQPLRTCPNCGAPAHGPYCYACGQSEKGMIRHLSEVLSALADIVFNVDSRILQHRGKIVGGMTKEAVLRVDDADAGGPLPLRQPQQIG